MSSSTQKHTTTLKNKSKPLILEVQLLCSQTKLKIKRVQSWSLPPRTWHVHMLLVLEDVNVHIIRSNTAGRFLAAGVLPGQSPHVDSDTWKQLETFQQLIM